MARSRSRPTWGRGSGAGAPGGGRTPPHDEGAEQSVLGSMLLSKDAIADVVEVLRGVDFYRPAHELILRRGPRPLRPRRACRRHHGRRRADPRGRHRARRRRALPAHAGRAASRWRRTPATTPGSSARRRSCAGWSTPAPRSSRSGTRPRARSTTSSTRPRPRSTPSPSGAHLRTMRRCPTIMEQHDRRARGHRQPRRRDGRRAHRLRRARRRHQRAAWRTDGHRRGAPGHRQGAGPRHLRCRLRRAGPRWATSRSATS